DEISPMIPFVAAIAAPLSNEEDLRIRLFLLNKCHPSLAGTGSVCISACSAILGSIVNSKARIQDLHSFILRIRHPLGLMPLTVVTRESNRLYPDYLKLGYGR